MKVAATFVLIMGLLAGLGNWLWLVGVLPEPEQHVRDARWVYQFFSLVIAGSMFAIGSDRF